MNNELEKNFLVNDINILLMQLDDLKKRAPVSLIKIQQEKWKKTFNKDVEIRQKEKQIVARLKNLKIMEILTIGISIGKINGNS
ncbi:MAG TPA: hypothetical protein DCL39_06625 [Alteromonas macleodii]|nr:hypothetical protein [Alteromonas macleodii]|tara:strand:+ start:127 stop:378 length:252 start_codon:yes stop_codon:yes gene_type:complete